MSAALPKPAKRAPRPRKPISRKAKPRQLSQTPKAKARRKADREWSRFVKAQANTICQRCFGPGTDAHHVVSRRYAATRHAPANGVWLCRKCHNFAHAKPKVFRQWFSLVWPHRWLYVQMALEVA